MKTGLNALGFTIVETMIVLAITGALLLMAMLMISGQQGKTEFTQAINDIQAQINDVINNVGTGYYAKTTDFSCSAGASGPVFNASGSTGQGSNTACVFMGRAVQFIGNS